MGERPDFECRRGEDRGADEGVWGAERGGCEENGVWGWVSPPHWGRVWDDAVPPPQKKNRLRISNRRMLVQTECFLYSSN